MVSEKEKGKEFDFNRALIELIYEFGYIKSKEQLLEQIMALEYLKY